MPRQSKAEKLFGKPDEELNEYETRAMLAYYVFRREYGRAKLLSLVEACRAKFGDEAIQRFDGVEIGLDGKLRLTDDEAEVA